MKIDIEERVLHFKQPAGTSRGVYTERRIWLVHVSDGMTVGVGECAPLLDLSCDALEPYIYNKVLRGFCDQVEQTGEIPYEAMRDPELFRFHRLLEGGFEREDGVDIFGVQHVENHIRAVGPYVVRVALLVVDGAGAERLDGRGGDRVERVSGCQAGQSVPEAEFVGGAMVGEAVVRVEGFLLPPGVAFVGEEEAVVRHPAVEVDAGDDGDGAEDKQERGMAKPAPMRHAAGEEQPGPGQRRDPADEVGERMKRSHADHDQDVGQREQRE